MAACKQASKQASKHTHARAQCGPASVGLAQARPNQLPPHHTLELTGQPQTLLYFSVTYEHTDADLGSCTSDTTRYVNYDNVFEVGRKCQWTCT